MRIKMYWHRKYWGYDWTYAGGKSPEPTWLYDFLVRFNT